MGDVVVVGERMYLPQKSVEILRRVEAKWRERPLDYMMMYPAFGGGGLTQRRLETLLGLLEEEVDRSVNLLWTDNRPGTWSEKAAREYAELLLNWGRDDGAAFVCLGRRVADAFGRCAGPGRLLSRFGDAVSLEGFPPWFVAPHPSGRSRIFNDQEFLAQMARELQKFVRQFREGT